MSEIQAQAFGLLLPSGKLVQIAAAEEDGVWAMMGLLFGLSEEEAKRRMVQKGGRTVPVIITTAEPEEGQAA